LGFLDFLTDIDVVAEMGRHQGSLNLFGLGAGFVEGCNGSLHR
jgi:hypothetical protein